jgi:hypothetical protein
MGLSSGAWLYNYRQTDQSADFWGRQRAELLLRGETIELLTLSDPIPASTAPSEMPADQSAPSGENELIAGRAIVNAHDLSGARGLVHFRHALTYDENFDWDELTDDGSQLDPAFALRFADDNAQLVLLFPSDFTILGRLESDGEAITSMPCPKLAPVLMEYLRQIGALPNPTGQ